MHDPRGRAGVHAGEVVIVLVLVGVLVLLIVSALPRQRETARAASCRENLRRIGVATALYDGQVGHLPTVPDLGEASAPGPLAVLLATLGQSDLTAMTTPLAPPPREPDPILAPRRVPGFLCPSDPNATLDHFRAPVSYRATAGSAIDGGDGPFAPGRTASLALVESGDGTSYTAGFAERLVGTGTDGVEALANYALVPDLATGGCPAAPPSSWRGDAGSSWQFAGWVATLYNHAPPPDAPRSCVATGGREAFLGASSGHAEGVHVLMLDGSVKRFTPTIDPKVWAGLAGFTDSTGSRPPRRDPPPPPAAG